MSKIACIDAKIRANGCEENIDSKHAGLAADSCCSLRRASVAEK